MTAKDTVTHFVKISNSGKPGLIEDSAATAIGVTSINLDKSTTTVATAAITTLNVIMASTSAGDPSSRATAMGAGRATAIVTGAVLTVAGIVVGTADIIAMTNDGLSVTTCRVTVS